jgi:hypothetical protein
MDTTIEPADDVEVFQTEVNKSYNHLNIDEAIENVKLSQDVTHILSKDFEEPQEAQGNQVLLGGGDLMEAPNTDTAPCLTTSENNNILNEDLINSLLQQEHISVENVEHRDVKTPANSPSLLPGKEESFTYDENAVQLQPQEVLIAETAFECHQMPSDVLDETAENNDIILDETAASIQDTPPVHKEQNVCWEEGSEQPAQENVDPGHNLVQSETVDAVQGAGDASDSHVSHNIPDKEQLIGSPTVEEACFEKTDCSDDIRNVENVDASQNVCDTALVDVEDDDMDSSLPPRNKSNVFTESLPAMAESVPAEKLIDDIAHGDDTFAKSVSDDSVFMKNDFNNESMPKLDISDDAAKAAFADDEDEDTTAELIPPLPQDAFMREEEDTEGNVEMASQAFQDVMMSSPSEVHYQELTDNERISLSQKMELEFREMLMIEKGRPTVPPAPANQENVTETKVESPRTLQSKLKTPEDITKKSRIVPPGSLQKKTPLRPSSAVNVASRTPPRVSSPRSLVSPRPTSAPTKRTPAATQLRTPSKLAATSTRATSSPRSTKTTTRPASTPRTTRAAQLRSKSSPRVTPQTAPLPTRRSVLPPDTGSPRSALSRRSHSIHSQDSMHSSQSGRTSISRGDVPSKIGALATTRRMFDVGK